MSKEAEIHMNGAKRHRGSWLRANQRAVEALCGTGLTPSNPKVKLALPRVLLRVLDGIMLDDGKKWDAEKEAWVVQD